jgi:hypothetical protein
MKYAILALLLASGFVLADSCSVVYEVPTYCYWLLLNYSNISAPVGGATCTMSVLYSNGTIYNSSYNTEYFVSNQSYRALIGSDWKVGTYFSSVNCYKGSTWINAPLSFDIDVMSQPITVNVTGFVTGAGGGGVDSGVFLFVGLAGIFTLLYLGSKWQRHQEKRLAS